MCVTSLNPLFLMLSFLALTKSNSLPYSSLQKERPKVRNELSSKHLLYLWFVKGKDHKSKTHFKSHKET